MTEPGGTGGAGSGPRPRYDLLELIATGGMGRVWRGHDTLLDREVAVKVLKAEYAGDDLFRTRFEAEARTAAGIQHPHVASVLDYGERVDEDGTPRPMLVMELVDGQPLSALIGDPQLTYERAGDLVAQAGEGLAAAHQRGIVHRDVKPGNLLVDRHGHVKVTDFGIARAADAAALTMTGHLLGTPHYLSPEQAEGERATARSDVYALGVVLFECLTGTKPFEADSPVVTALRHVRDPLPPLPDDVPERLRQVVDRACAKDPAMRFADGAEMAAAIRGEVPVWPDVSATQVMTAPTGPTLTLPSSAPAGPSTTEVAARRSTLLWVGAAVLAVLLLVPVVWAARALLGGGDGADGPVGPTLRATRSVSASGPAATVQVDPADYVGRPRGEAERSLRDAGLEPVVERRTNDGGESAGTVAEVRPTGQVDRGSQVTLVVWDEAAPPPAKHDPPEKKHPPTKKHGHKGKGKR